MDCYRAARMANNVKVNVQNDGGDQELGEIGDYTEDELLAMVDSTKPVSVRPEPLEQVKRLRLISMKMKMKMKILLQ